jgi:hypothetical protein
MRQPDEDLSDIVIRLAAGGGPTVRMIRIAVSGRLLSFATP